MYGVLSETILRKHSVKMRQTRQNMIVARLDIQYFMKITLQIFSD